MRPMRPESLSTALLLLVGLLGVATTAYADREVTVREESAAFPVEAARTLVLEVGVGELVVDITDGDRVETELTLSCERGKTRCRERAAELRLESVRHGDDLVLRIDEEDRHGRNHPELTLRVAMPAAMGLAVDLGVGELDVDGIEGDVRVDLGVGEARIVMPEAAVRSVSLDVGVGEAHLSPRPDGADRHGFLFLGNEVDWKDGAGEARVVVDVGVGEASVRLRP